jgi:hypothetical protein
MTLPAQVDDLRAIERLIRGLPVEKQIALARMPGIAQRLEERWRPNIGPQEMAYNSTADVILYGGEAGGGKSGLIVGLALTAHKRSLVMRRQYSDLSALIEDMLEKHGTRDGYNGSAPAKLRTKDGRLIEFGGAKNAGDEQHWKGQPHDLLAIDEASQFLESQVRFLMGWVRSIDPNQHCRVVLATNPPETEAEGQWLKEMFGPWLNPVHPLYRGSPHHRYGRDPGELLWVITDEDGKDKWVDSPEPVEIGERTVTPESRTFIPASLSDNPYLTADDKYQKKLDSLPEPLRSAVRDGNWMIAHSDDERQIIPTAWVMAAQQRWTPQGHAGLAMTAMALDCAGGGEDAAVAAPRYGGWYAELVSVSGKDTADGSAMAGVVVKHRKDGCPIVIDVGGGYAGAVIERFKDNQIPYQRFDGSAMGMGNAKGSGLRFANKRAEAWWKFREELDPDQEGGSAIALPPDERLRAELTAPRFEVGARGIKVESKDEIRDRIGRSPDRADAVVMALSEGNKAAVKRMNSGRGPKVVLGYAKQKRK